MIPETPFQDTLSCHTTIPGNRDMDSGFPPFLPAKHHKNMYMEITQQKSIGLICGLHYTEHVNVF